MAWVIGVIGIGLNSVVGIGIVGVCLDIVPRGSFVSVGFDGVTGVVVPWFGVFGGLAWIVGLNGVDTGIGDIGEGGSKNCAKK